MFKVLSGLSAALLPGTARLAMILHFFAVCVYQACVYQASNMNVQGGHTNKLAKVGTYIYDFLNYSKYF